MTEPRALSTRERLALLVHRGMDRRLSGFAVWLMRRTRGSLAKRYRVDALVLTTTGRRSGRVRRVVLQFFRDGDAMIVAATNDGGRRHPAWYLNLRSAATAQVEVAGRTMDVEVQELAPGEAAGWWDRIVARAPAYERYERATKRRFPIVRLVPLQPDQSSPGEP